MITANETRQEYLDRAHANLHRPERLENESYEKYRHRRKIAALAVKRQFIQPVEPISKAKALRRKLTAQVGRRQARKWLRKAREAHKLIAKQQAEIRAQEAATRANMPMNPPPLEVIGG